MGTKKVKDDLSHAFNYGYPVRVTFKGCVRKGLITALSRNSFIMSVCNGAWHNDSSVISVERVETSTPKDIRFVDEGEVVVEDWFGWQCHVAYGCNERQGTGRHCKDKTCQQRMIWTDIAKKRQDDKPSTPEPERWRVGEDESSGVDIWNQKGIRIGIIWDSDDAKVAAASPQLRDALRAIQNEYASNDEKSITCIIRKEIWQQLLDALKAGG